MTSLPQLDDLEKDLLTELFNLGVGRAAASLSEMVRDEINLSVPQVSFVTAQTLVNEVDSDIAICGISQDISGPFRAKAMLVFPEQGSQEVVRQMLGWDMPQEAIAELQQEAFTEVGNIVLNACIASIADALQDPFEIDVPRFNLGRPESIFASELGSIDSVSLLLHINMSLSGSEVVGHLVFLLSSDSLQKLHQCLKDMVARIAGGAA